MPGMGDVDTRTVSGDAKPPLIPPTTPAEQPAPDRYVLHARTSIPDPAFAYRLRFLVDGKPVDGVPWGWSVHPLPLGEHSIERFHRAGVRARRLALAFT